MRRWVALVVAAMTTTGALALAAPAGAQSSGIPDLAAVRELVGSIPDNHRYHCQIVDPALEGSIIAAETASIRAMVRCYSIDELSRLWYVLTDTTDATNRVYHAYAGTFDPAAPYRDEDAQCPGETTWGFGDAKDDGLLACYYSGASLEGQPHDESVVLVWTYDTGKIVAFAETPLGDSDASALKQWWRDNSGPLSHPSRVKGLVDWTLRDRSAEQTLVSHVPKAIRGGCAVQDKTRDHPLSGARIWTSAVLSCRSGNITVAYGLMHPAVVENFVDEFTPSGEGDPCPASGTWSEGKGKKRHKVGNYVCFVETNPDGSQRAWMIWSQRELGIAATASLVTTNNDASEVYEWWEGDAGPV